MLGVTVKIQSADNKLIQVRNNLRDLSFKSYMLIKSVCLALSCASQAAQAHNARSYIVLLVRELSMKRDMPVAYNMIEFDYAKHDSRLAGYGGVVLQRFEF